MVSACLLTVKMGGKCKKVNMYLLNISTILKLGNISDIQKLLILYVITQLEF
jgi:hypothetical protein